MFVDSEKTISPTGAVLGLVNGMVGSLVLLLPVLALSSGYLASAIIIVITGCSCTVSSWIYLQHLGEEPDIGLAIKKHSKGNNFAKNIYQFLTWFYIIIVCAQYFQLSNIQWEILIPELQENFLYHVIANIVNGVLMFLLVIVVKYWEIGGATMAYGVVSLLIYLIYLLYICISENRKNVEPTADFLPFAKGVQELGGSMTQGFIVSFFFIPFLQKMGNNLQTRNRYFRYTLYSYIIGGLIYQFIAEVGAFGINALIIGILYRQPSPSMPTQTYGILSYLDHSWMLYAVCIAYLIHLYTVYPEYLLINKTKFFDFFEEYGCVETSRKSINLKQIVYIAVIVAVCMIFSLIRLPITKVMIINGGVLSCLFIYIAPAILHIYCMFWIPEYEREPFSTKPELIASSKDTKRSNNSRRKSEIQISDARSFSSNKSKGLEIPQSSEQLDERLISSKKSSNRRVEFGYVQCECDHYKRSKWQKIGIVIFLILMIIFGVAIMTVSILAVI